MASSSSIVYEDLVKLFELGKSDEKVYSYITKKRWCFTQQSYIPLWKAIQAGNVRAVAWFCKYITNDHLDVYIGSFSNMYIVDAIDTIIAATLLFPAIKIKCLTIASEYTPQAIAKLSELLDLVTIESFSVDIESYDILFPIGDVISKITRYSNDTLENLTWTFSKKSVEDEIGWFITLMKGCKKIKNILVFCYNLLDEHLSMIYYTLSRNQVMYKSVSLLFDDGSDSLPSFIDMVSKDRIKRLSVGSKYSLTPELVTALKRTKRLRKLVINQKIVCEKEVYLKIHQ